MKQLISKNIYEFFMLFVIVTGFFFVTLMLNTYNEQKVKAIEAIVPALDGLSPKEKSEVLEKIMLYF